MQTYTKRGLPFPCPASPPPIESISLIPTRDTHCLLKFRDALSIFTYILDTPSFHSVYCLLGHTTLPVISSDINLSADSKYFSIINETCSTWVVDCILIALIPTRDTLSGTYNLLDLVAHAILDTSISFGTYCLFGTPIFHSVHGLLGNTLFRTYCWLQFLLRIDFSADGKYFSTIDETCSTWVVDCILIALIPTWDTLSGTH